MSMASVSVPNVAHAAVDTAGLDAAVSMLA